MVIKSRALCPLTEGTYYVKRKEGIKLSRTNEKALAAFMANMSEIQAHLAVLTGHVNDHMDVAPEHVNWGHVGDAGYALELLTEVNRFLNLK